MFQRIKSVAFYIIAWLSYYQIVEIVTTPSLENLTKLLGAILAGILLAYVMGFEARLAQNKEASNR